MSTDRYETSDRYDHHRSRSRDKHQSNYRGRSQSSEQNNAYQKKKTEQRSHHKPHRVKFNNVADIKVFRKDDEPNCKGLTESQLIEYMNKIENEKGSSLYSMNWDSNWDNAKHRDAQLENNSIKQQKEKEKMLNQKLHAMKQEMDFYSPLLLNLPATEIKIEAPGHCSLEKDAHTVRLNDVLGCFYTHWKQIPAQPAFQIQNKSTKSTSQPKNISFDKLMFNDIKDLAINDRTHDRIDAKPLKGILKLSPEELKKEQQADGRPIKIDPNLINIIREINANKGLYTKDKTQILLKPYKESGELDYLMKNPEILNGIIRSGSAPRNQTQYPPNPTYPPRHSTSPQPQIPPTYTHSQPIRPNPQYRTSADRSSPYQPMPTPTHNTHNPQQYSYPSAYPPQYPTSYNPNPSYMNNNYPQTNPGNNMNYQNTQSQNSMYINKNYRTVPCKYYHSVQGCVKANNCTYIHDEQYAGKPSPLMHKYNMNVGPNTRVYDSNGQQQARGSLDRQPPSHGYQPPNYQYNNNQYQQPYKYNYPMNTQPQAYNNNMYMYQPPQEKRPE